MLDNYTKRTLRTFGHVIGKNALRVFGAYVVLVITALVSVYIHELAHFAGAGQMPYRVMHLEHPEAYIERHTVFSDGVWHIDQPTMIYRPTRTWDSIVSFGTIPHSSHDGNYLAMAILDGSQSFSPGLVAAMPLIVSTLLTLGLCWLFYWKPRWWSMGMLLSMAQEPLHNYHHLEELGIDRLGADIINGIQMGCALVLFAHALWVWVDKTTMPRAPDLLKLWRKGLPKKAPEQAMHVARGGGVISVHPGLPRTCSMCRPTRRPIPAGEPA